MELIHFSAINPCDACSVPLPNGTNVVIQYYTDWVFQVATTITYYTMLFTTAFLFTGMCFYIAEMVKDLRSTLIESNEDLPATTKRIINGITFHNELLKFVNVCLIWSRNYLMMKNRMVGGTAAGITWAVLFLPPGCSLQHAPKTS